MVPFELSFFAGNKTPKDNEVQALSRRFIAGKNNVKFHTNLDEKQ